MLVLSPFITVEVACTGDPCTNGGTCEYQGDGKYTCRCLSGYTGTHCEIGKYRLCFALLVCLDIGIMV